MVLSLRRIIAAQGLAFAVAIAGAAHAQVPVPQPRPAEAEDAPPDIPMPQPRPEGAPAATSEAEPSAPSACREGLAAEIAIIEALPRVTGADGCGIDDPVRLSAVFLKDKRRIPMSPPVMLSCPMADALARWLREDVAEAASLLDTTLTGVATGQGYQCRGVNGVMGARTSQHGRGNAMDLRAIRFADGTAANPTDASLPREFRERIKSTACKHFTTVLGPGSDRHHDVYIHLDVAPRKNGYRICQWNVYEAADVPLPRPRPPEAPPRATPR
jgi:hypothetical protein